MPRKSPSSHRSKPKFGIWRDLGTPNTLPQTACQNSNWFGNYDCSKNAILGSRTHFSSSSSFSRLFFPPKFNTLPVLRFWPNLVHLFFATFPRWVFRDFMKFFHPPPRKNLVFLYFLAIFVPPEFNTLPVLGFWPNLVPLFFATFPRWVFQDFLNFLHPPRKNLVFYIFFAIFVPPELHPSRAPILTILGTLILHLC